MNPGRRLMAWLRLAVMALSVFGACAANALVPVATQWSMDATNVPYTSPKDQAVSNWIAYCTPINCLGPYSLVHDGYSDASTVNIKKYFAGQPQTPENFVGTSFMGIGSIQACPANSVAVAGGCQCNTGFDESGGQCVPHVNACTAAKNTVRVVNWTVGFTRSPDGNDTNIIGPGNAFPSDNRVCSGGCAMVGDPFAPGSQAFKGQVPTSQGLYRLSLDVPMVNTGDECTASLADAPANPTTADIPCPGYVGEVNGKLGCYGTADKPVSTQPGTPVPGTPAAGNPAAGPKPATGDGSGTGSAGRTPSAGAGGNAGGPAGAAVGGTGGRGGGATTTGGTGTVASPGTGEEQAACGAPGQPVCAVKMDETGMPSNGGDGMGTGKLDKAMDDAVEGLSKATDSSSMDTSWGGVPSWFNSSQCTPWQLGTLPIINRAIVLDICVIQPYAIAVMSFLWVVGTFFAIIGMVGRVVGSGVH